MINQLVFKMWSTKKMCEMKLIYTSQSLFVIWYWKSILSPLVPKAPRLKVNSPFWKLVYSVQNQINLICPNLGAWKEHELVILIIGVEIAWLFEEKVNKIYLIQN